MSYTYKVKKGDTLNKIAQQHGFTNYKEAGIQSVPSGNFDLIREGEEIALSNYDPNKVSTIQDTAQVVSSEDLAQEFEDNSDRVDGMLAEDQNRDERGENVGSGDTADTGEAAKKEPEKKTKEQVIADGDSEIDTWESSQKEVAKEAAEKRRKEREGLYTTSLAAIDSTTQAAIDSINATYDSLESQQERINDINIARVKAYGLSKGGQYTPLMFTDSISNRELEAANKLKELDSQRNAAIAEAKAARDKGESDLLENKLNALDKIDEDIRTKLKEIQEEAEAKHKLVRDKVKTAEEEMKAKIEEAVEKFTNIAPALVDEYEKSDDKDAYIKKIMEETGLDYGQVYSILRTASFEGQEEELDIKKKKADISAAEALAEQRRASKDKEDSEAGMKKDLPDKFESEDDFKDKRSDFIKKYGTDGEKYFDAVYFDDDNEEFRYKVDGKEKKLDFGSVAPIHSMAQEKQDRKAAEEAAVGDTVTIAGKKYKKVGEDDYEPVE